MSHVLMIANLQYCLTTKKICLKKWPKYFLILNARFFRRFKDFKNERQN